MNLLELNIAGFLLTIILLAIISTELQSLRITHQSHKQTLATIQLQNMLERLRANRLPGARQQELIRWNKDNIKLLPHMRGSFQCQMHYCAVIMQWRDFTHHKIQEGMVIQ